MADFNIRPSEQPVNQYTNASSGLRSTDNDAFGKLFGAAAGILDSGVKVANEIVLDEIRDQAYMETEIVRNEFGIASATTLEEEVGTNTPAVAPAVLADSISHLEGLQTAFVQGDMKASHYWARMNTAVRQLRGRYPGYRDEIDQIVSGITGAKPANALQSALFSEWGEAASAAKAASASGQDKYLNLVTSMSSSIGLPMDFQMRADNGQPYGFEELLVYQSNINRNKQAISSAQAEITLAQAQGNLTKENILGTTSEMMNAKVNEQITMNTSSFGSFSQVSAKISEISMRQATGQDPYDPTELSSFISYFGDLRTLASQELDAIVNEPIGGDPANGSVARYLSPQEISDRKTAALAPIDNMIEALTNGNYGAVAVQIAQFKAEEDYKGRKMRESLGPEMDRFLTFSQMSPELANFALAQEPKLGNALGTVALGFLTAGTFNSSGTRGQANFASDTNKLEASITTDTGPVVRQFLDLIGNTPRLFEEDKMTVAEATNMAQYIFGQPARETLSVFSTKADQVTAFTKMTGPGMQELMSTLRKTDPAIYEQYGAFVAESFHFLFTQSANDLVGLGANYTKYQDVDIQYDRVNGFRVLEKNNYLFNQGQKYRELNEGIQDMNRVLRGISAFMVEEGVDPAQEMLAFMDSMGFDMNPTRQGPLDEVLIDALHNSLQNAVNGPRKLRQAAASGAGSAAGSLVGNMAGVDGGV